MFNIKLIFVGGEKETYFKDAADEYIKRLSTFCKYSEKSLKEEKLSENPSDLEIKNALSKEAQKITESIPPKTYKIALCIEGKQLSSNELAEKMNYLPDMGYSGAVFIIGSSFGLSEELKSQCDLKLSMSKMTFPHRLARVMLLEQLYRAFSIIGGRKYHK